MFAYYTNALFQLHWRPRRLLFFPATASLIRSCTFHRSLLSMTLLHFVLCGSKLSIPYGEDTIKQQQEQKLPFEVISRQLQCNHDMQMCYASLDPYGNSFFRTPIINHNNDRRMDIGQQHSANKEKNEVACKGM